MLQRGRASSIVIALIEEFLLRCNLPLTAEKRKMLSSSAYPSLDNCEKYNDLLHASFEEYQLCYPINISEEKLRQIYLAGGVFIFSDLGVYVRSLREERGLSIRQLAKTVAVTHPAISALETKMGSRVKLNDLIKIDNALRLDGELIVFAWRTAELYLGIYPKSISDTAPRQLQSHEVTVIERLVIISRLFQHYFPDNKEGLDEYRKQSYKGFSDWIR